MKRIIAIAMLIFAGCGSIYQQSGDFTIPFMAELHSYGAIVPDGVKLSVIDTKWSISRDSFGFVVRLPSERFVDVDTLLRHLYGTPQIWSDKNLEGQPHGVFGVEQAGVALQYVRTKDQVEIICIKKQEKTKTPQNQPAHATARTLAAPGR